jgi:hypothetical protein
LNEGLWDRIGENEVRLHCSSGEAEKSRLMQEKAVKKIKKVEIDKKDGPRVESHSHHHDGEVPRDLSGCSRGMEWNGVDIEG